MERFKDLRESDIDYLANAWDAIEDSDLPEESDFDAAEPIEVEKPEKEEPKVDYISAARNMLDDEEAKEKEKAKKKADKEKQKIYDDAYKQAQKDLERKWRFKKRDGIAAVSSSGKTLYVRRVWTDDNKPFYIIGDETDGSRDAYYNKHKAQQHGKSMTELLAKIPLIKYERDYPIHELLKAEKWCGWDGKANEGVFETQEAFYLKGKASEPQLLEFLARAAAGDLRAEYFDKDLVDIDEICHVIAPTAANKALEIISDNLSKETTSLLFIGYLQGLFTNDSGSVYNDDFSEETVYEELLDCCAGGEVQIIVPTAIGNYWKRLIHSLTPRKNKQNVNVISVNDSYIINEVEKLKGMHFDTIIANPPFAYGNEITKTVLENIDFDNYINIMPMSGYKKNNLAAHIIKTEPLPKDAFKDATVQAYISVLSKEAREVSKEELRIQGYRTDLQKFYRENLKREKSWGWKAFIYPCCKTQEECVEKLKALNPNTDFMFTLRTCQDGVHTTQNCADYRWNIEKSTNPLDIHLVWDKSLKQWHSTVGFLFFNTPEEHKNFCDFWYRSNLSNKLVHGLNKSSGSPEDAIPRVDWSRPWTDEEILREFGYDKPSEIKKILS